MIRQNHLTVLAAALSAALWAGPAAAQNQPAPAEPQPAEPGPEATPPASTEPGPEATQPAGTEPDPEATPPAEPDTAPPPPGTAVPVPEHPRVKRIIKKTEHGTTQEIIIETPEGKVIKHRIIKRVTDALDKVITPHVAIAGGYRFERLFQREGETAQSRSPTQAVSRMGVHGRVGEHITFRSEIEANIGHPLGYGASVWEGQAQLSVRDQWVQYKKHGAAVAVGRIADAATIDFYSAHVADLLLTDFYTRWPIIFSGGDRGTGILGTYDISPALRAGLTVHSTNPTGLTGSYQTGGRLFPFTRPFGLAAAQVGRSADGSPDYNLHMYFGTASLMYTAPRLEIKTAFQAYSLDTQMSTDADERIYGYNFRGNIRVKPADNIAVWLNGSRNENEMLDPMDATVKLAETYTVYTFGTGIDYNYDGENGVGVQYAFTRQHEQAEPLWEHYFNVGTTYWLEPGVLSVGARIGYYRLDDGQTDPTGHASLFLSGRLIL